MNKLYGIKNCDTIKKAKKWLEKNHIAYQFHDYRSDGLDDTLLDYLQTRLGWEAMLNRRSTSWRQLPDDVKTDLCREKAITLMRQHPTLIKRPILDTGDKILIGFSAENYQVDL